MKQYSDYTYLSSYLRCPLQWHRRYVLQLEPLRGGKGQPLLAGSLLHRLLEIHYTGGNVEAALDDLYGSSGIEPYGDFDYMTRGHFATIMANYADEYPHDGTFRSVQMIEAPLLSDELRFGGIPDMIVETSDGELEVWDHKTSTGWMGNLEARHGLSRQLPLYAVLASAHLGRPVRRAVLNGIHMGKGASNPKSKAERFMRRQYIYTEEQLERAAGWITEVEGLIATGLTPMNPDAHCSWCEFKRLCEAPNARVGQSVLLTDFRKREVTGTLLSGADMEEEAI